MSVYLLGQWVTLPEWLPAIYFGGAVAALKVFGDSVTVVISARLNRKGRITSDTRL